MDIVIVVVQQSCNTAKLYSSIIFSGSEGDIVKIFINRGGQKGQNETVILESPYRRER